MNRRSAGALILLSVLLASALLVFLVEERAADPLAQYRTADGKLTIPGGRMTKELQSLLFPGPAPKEYTTFAPDHRSPYPTLNILGTVHAYESAPAARIDPAAPARPFARIGGVIWSYLRPMIVDALDFFTGRAAAVDGTCGSATTNNCYWIVGTGNFSDTLSHWSSTTGPAGTPCLCTPASTNFIIFDANSGAGTATQNIATFTSGPVTMTNSSVTVAGSSNTWKVGGNWTDNSGTNHFSIGTSTVEFTANTTVLASTAVSSNFYNITVDDNIDFILTANHIRVDNVETINLATTGSYQMKTGGQTIFQSNTNGIKPLVLSVGGSTTWCQGQDAGNAIRNFNFQTGAAVTSAHIDAGNYVLCGIVINGNSGGTETWTADGNITPKKISVQPTSGTGILAMGAFNLTVTQSTAGESSSLGTGARPGAITFSSGTFDMGNAGQAVFTIATAGSYIQWGSSTGHAMRGTYTNSSTSSSWSAGTGTVAFTSSTGGTMFFAGANLTGNEFNNMTFTSSAATAQTFTMSTRGLVWGGTLTVSDSSSTTALATANLGLTGGALVVGNSGILTANASTVTATDVTMTGGTSGTITLTSGSWTVSGNWDTSGAGSTFTKGTSTITLSGTTKTVSFLNSSNNFNNLTITGTISTTGTNIDATSAMLSGTLTGAGTFTVTGNWDSSTGFTFTKSTGTIAMSGTSKTVKQQSASVNGFYNLAVSGTISILTNPLDVSNTLTTSGSGTLTTSGNNVTGSPAVSLVGTGGITGTTSALTLGTITVGSGTTFSVSSGTITGTATSVTGTISASGAATWTFTTVTVNTAGVVTANAATVASTDVTMTGGTSGTITLTSGSWVVSGNWDTSGAGSTLTKGTSTVTMSGTAKTVKLLNSSNGFYNLTASGSITAQSTVWSSGTLLVSGTLVKTGQSIVFQTLTATSGTITDGAINATKFSVSNSGANLTTISAFTIWTADTQYKWTDTFSAGTDTFTITNSTHLKFNVLKNGAAFITGGNVVGSAITFTMAFGDPDVEVDPFTSVTCTTYYWIGGTGVWSDFANHWVSTSGGATPCDTYPNNTSSDVVFDANSGAGTATVDVDPTTGSITIGGSVALSAGSHTISPNGNWDSNAGTFTVGTSTVAMTGTAKTVKINGTAGFYNLTVSGTIAQLSAISVSNALSTSGSGTLTTSGFNIVGGAPVSLAGAGGITGTTSSITVGGITVGTGTTFSITTGTITAGGAVSVAGALTDVAGNSGFFTFGSNPLTVNNGGVVSANQATVTLANVTMTGGASGTITLTSGSWTVSGNWDTSGAGSTFTRGTSAVTMSGTAKTVKILNSSNGFYNLAITGTISQTSALDVSNTLTLSNVLDTSNFAMSLKDATISAPGALKLGSAGHTVGGTWTNNTASASWSAGSGTVTFTSVTGATMTFAGTSFDEFNNVVFSSSAATPQTFTMSTNGLRFQGTLTVQDSVSTTTLATANLAIDNFSSGTLVIGNGGILTANASSVFVGSVQMTGGLSGAITITTGNWQLGAVGNSSWDTSGAGSTFTKGTSTITIGNGSQTATIKHLVGQGFFGLVFFGGGTTTTMLSDVESSDTLAVNGALDMGVFSATFFVLSVSATGSIMISGFVVSNFTISTNAGLVLMRGTFDWFSDTRTSPVDVSWGMTPDTATAKITMTFGGLPTSTSFTLTRDAATVATATSDLAGSVTFAVSSGWSFHTMEFKGTKAPGGGGGGGNPPPSGDTILITQVSGLTYYFTIQTTSGTVTSATWNFGDGRTDTGASVYHTYAAPGTYAVTAQVTKSNGTVETLTKDLAIPAGTSVVAYAIAIASVVLLLLAIVVRDEATKYLLAISGIALLVYQLSSFWSFGSIVMGTLATGALLLLAGIGCLIVSFAPSKNKNRARGAWLILGTLTLVAYWALVVAHVV